MTPQEDGLCVVWLYLEDELDACHGVVLLAHQAVATGRQQVALLEHVIHLWECPFKTDGRVLLRVEGIYCVVKFLNCVEIVTLPMQLLGLTKKLSSHVDLKHDPLTIQLIGVFAHDVVTSAFFFVVLPLSP